MSTSIADKIVVITGAAKGIGFAVADNFLKNNAKKVILLDITEYLGHQAEKQLNDKYGYNKADFIKCDVTRDLQGVSEKIFNEFKTVDILVNNAGFFDESEIDKTVEINMKAVLRWSMLFYEHMRIDKNGKGGTIINMSSVWGYKIVSFTPTYQATKFAIYGFTKSLGHVNNHLRTGVRVVGVCPGYTDTDMTAKIKPWDSTLEEGYLKLLKEFACQKPDAVGKATIDVFLKAQSGTLWEIAGAKPIVEV